MVTAMWWMSGSVIPAYTVSQVSPPSLLCRTPSTSIPAQTLLWSTGSTTRAVTLGTTTLGHSSTRSTLSFSQLRPASLVLKRADGRVPAKMVSGSTGSTARTQMGTSFMRGSSMGDSSFSQLSPPSRVR